MPLSARCLPRAANSTPSGCWSRRWAFPPTAALCSLFPDLLGVGFIPALRDLTLPVRPHPKGSRPPPSPPTTPQRRSTGGGLTWLLIPPPLRRHLRSTRYGRSRPAQRRVSGVSAARWSSSSFFALCSVMPSSLTSRRRPPPVGVRFDVRPSTELAARLADPADWGCSSTMARTRVGLPASTCRQRDGKQERRDQTDDAGTAHHDLLDPRHPRATQSKGSLSSNQGSLANYCPAHSRSPDHP
jgi:hypothetical protein